LDDVHPTGQHGVGEFGEVASLTARIGAQIQPCGLEPGSTVVHTQTLAASVEARHGSPGNGD
jgi:hypothetical protein